MARRGAVLVIRGERVDHLLAQRVEDAGAFEQRPGIQGHRVLAARVDVQRGRRRADRELVAGRADRQPAGLGDRPHAVGLRPGKPLRGRGATGRAPDRPAEDREHLVDRTGRDPGGDIGAAVGPQHPGDLGDRPRRIGREDHAEDRDDDVERRVGHGQGQRVADEQLEREPRRRGALLGHADEPRRGVHADDVGAAGGGEQRAVAGAAGDVEHALAGARRRHRDDGGRHRLELRRGVLVASLAPVDHRRRVSRSGAATPTPGSWRNPCRGRVAGSIGGATR